MEGKLDFYDYGVQIANKSNEEIKKITDEIAAKYGEEAKDEFEIGIASKIDVNAYYDKNYATRKMINDYINKYHKNEIMREKVNEALKEIYRNDPDNFKEALSRVHTSYFFNKFNEENEFPKSRL